MILHRVKNNSIKASQLRNQLQNELKQNQKIPPPSNDS